MDDRKHGRLSECVKFNKQLGYYEYFISLTIVEVFSGLNWLECSFSPKTLDRGPHLTLELRYRWWILEDCLFNFRV